MYRSPSCPMKNGRRERTSSRQSLRVSLRVLCSSAMPSAGPPRPVPPAARGRSAATRARAGSSVRCAPPPCRERWTRRKHGCGDYHSSLRPFGRKTIRTARRFLGEPSELAQHLEEVLDKQIPALFTATFEKQRWRRRAESPAPLLFEVICPQAFGRHPTLMPNCNKWDRLGRVCSGVGVDWRHGD